LGISGKEKNNKGVSKRGEAPLKKNLPLPLDKGKGTKGMGLLKLRGIGLMNNLYRSQNH
jgi:hypothetical protein